MPFTTLTQEQEKDDLTDFPCHIKTPPQHNGTPMAHSAGLFS